MDFDFTEEQRLLRDTVRKLMQKHAPPEYVRQHDRERSYPEELFQACAAAGLLALPFPESCGGAGGSILDMVIVAEEIARVSADLVMA
jgi:alkylation response protein AidB-like acyl-CoA dehydrogenase